jgi:hypothetical protein
MTRVGMFTISYENQTANTNYTFMHAELNMETNLTLHTWPYFAMLPTAIGDSIAFRYTYYNNLPFTVAFYVSHIVKFDDNTIEVIRGHVSGNQIIPTGVDVESNTYRTLYTPYSYNKKKQGLMQIRIVVDKIENNRAVQRLVDTTIQVFIDPVNPEFRNTAYGLIPVVHLGLHQNDRILVIETIKSPFAGTLAEIRERIMQKINEIQPTLFGIQILGVAYTELNDTIPILNEITKGKIYLYIRPTATPSSLQPRLIPAKAIIAIAVVVGIIIAISTMYYDIVKTQLAAIMLEQANKQAQIEELNRMRENNEITSEQYLQQINMLNEVCRQNKNEITSLFNPVQDITPIIAGVLTLALFPIILDLIEGVNE